MRLVEPETKMSYWLYLPEDYVRSNGQRRATARGPWSSRCTACGPTTTLIPDPLLAAGGGPVRLRVVAPCCERATACHAVALRDPTLPYVRRDERAMLVVMDEVCGGPTPTRPRFYSPVFLRGYMAHYMMNRHPERFLALAALGSNFNEELLDYGQIPSIGERRSASISARTTSSSAATRAIGRGVVPALSVRRVRPAGGRSGPRATTAGGQRLLRRKSSGRHRRPARPGRSGHERRGHPEPARTPTRASPPLPMFPEDSSKTAAKLSATTARPPLTLRRRDGFRNRPQSRRWNARADPKPVSEPGRGPTPRRPIRQPTRTDWGRPARYRRCGGGGAGRHPHPRP